MDCRTCKHNSYIDLGTDWVSCSHPITLARMAQMQRWGRSEPVWLSMITADVPTSRIDELSDCQAWESAGDANATL